MVSNLRIQLILMVNFWCTAVLCVTNASLELSTSVYDTFTRYAYVCKASYCASRMSRDNDLAQPVTLRPEQQFQQSGYSDEEYYGCDVDGIELHIAKYLYSIRDLTNEESEELPPLTHAEGFFAVDHSGNGSIILAFRGTVNTRDYLTDIDIMTVDYEPLDENARKSFGDSCVNCKVHKGFYRRYKEVHDDIFPSVHKLLDAFPGYKLVVVGHSLGGSLALLTGLELALLGYHPLILSYGSPKVANMELARYMDEVFRSKDVYKALEADDGSIDEGCFRLIHVGDYVPLLPPGNKFIPVGLEFVINKEGLPQPLSSVLYNGLAHEQTHSIDFHFSDLFSFNWRQVLHAKDHAEYFWRVGACDDLHLG